MNMNANVLSKMLANQIQQHIKKIIHHNQVEFIPESQGCFNVHKSINVIHHTIKTKEKNHMIISIDAQQAFDKIQYPYMIKILTKVGIEGTYCNIKKIYLWQTHSHHNIQWCKAESLPTKIWKNVRMPTVITSIQYTIGRANHSNQTRKRKKNSIFEGRGKIFITCRQYDTI